jgi:hypothetical protein
VHLQSFLVNSFFYDSYIDSNDYLKPNKQNIRSDSITLTNKGYCATLYVGHKLSSTDRDKGWLFQDRDVTSAVKIVSYIPDAVPNTKAELGFNLLYDIILYADHTNTITYLKYSKIQDVLANLGGVIQICNVGWTMLFTVINYFNISFDLYSFTYLDNNKFLVTTYNAGLDSNLTTMARRDSLNLTSKKRLSLDESENRSDLSKNSNRELVLKTGCCRYIIAGICGKRSNYERMKIIHTKVKKELEISSYLRLKEDMCMLKSILFKKDEWKIFHPKLDFRDVYRLVNDAPVRIDGFEDYLIQSYRPEKIPRAANISSLNDQMRRLKQKYHSLEKNSYVRRTIVRENNFMQES